MANEILILSAYVGDRPDYLNKVIENQLRYAQRHDYKYEFVTQIEMKRFSEDNLAHFSWIKAQLVKEKLAEHSYVFWIDADSIFIDFESGLQDLIDENKNLIFTGDSYGVFNTGHFLIKNSNWSKRFLEEWMRYREIKFPKINSSHQDKNGYLVDQPAANILLRRGFNSTKQHSCADFDWMNGYIGNKSRKIKQFHWLVGPTRRFNILFARLLIHRSIRQNVSIVVQDRLNSYPFKLPGYRPKKKPKIIHFPGNSKDKITDYLKLVK